MSVDLPTPIAVYIAAENRGIRRPWPSALPKMLSCKTKAKTIQDLTPVKQWKAETKKKYQHTIEPLTVAQKDGRTHRDEPAHREFSRQSHRA
jgi:hypothetical protein